MPRTQSTRSPSPGDTELLRQRLRGGGGDAWDVQVYPGFRRAERAEETLPLQRRRVAHDLHVAVLV